MSRQFLKAMRSLGLASLLAMFAQPVRSQNQAGVGIPPYNSFAGGPDTINLSSLDAHYTVPLLNKAGRGLNASFALNYDSLIWYVAQVGSTNKWMNDPNTAFGWTFGGYLLGHVNATQTIALCSGTNFSTTYTNFAYIDGNGTQHVFAGTLTYNPPACGSPSAPINAVTTDGSGWSLAASLDTAGNLTTTVTSVDGTTVMAPNFAPSYAATMQDRNGNQISYNGSGTFTDTLGKTALTLSGTVPSITYSYSAPTGGAGAAHIVVSYVEYTVATYFHITGIADYPATANYLVDKVTYPDGSFYQFQYEATASGAACTPLSGTYAAHCVTARPSSVTLPEGGVITYSYGTGNGMLSDGGPSALTRTLTSGSWTGTWNYTRSLGTGAAVTTTINDPTTPTPNKTVVNFQGGYETERQVYQGSSSLLLTRMTCYNGSAIPCTSAAVGAPITKIETVNEWPGTHNLYGAQVRLYNATYGVLSEVDDYDYGSGAIGSLIRKTVYSPATLTNIHSFPQSVTVSNSGSTTVSQTAYNYDEGTVVATTGTPQHVTPLGSRGNLTSVKSYVNGTTFLTAHKTYFDTGNVQTVQDVNGNVQTFTYGNCTNSFPSNVSITSPSSMSTSYIWDCTGGVVTSVTDPNSQTAATAYTDTSFWRPSSVTAPYNGVSTVTTNYSYATSAPYTWTDLSDSIAGGTGISDLRTTYDGFGRQILSQKKQSPSSMSYDTVETDYDSSGRPVKTSIPFTSAAGTTSTTAKGVSTTYDGLSRVATQTDSGGGSTQYSYPENDVTITLGPAPSGENTKVRQLEYNGIAQLTSVCEKTAGASPWLGYACGQDTAMTGYWTRYSYDVAGRLLGVCQQTTQPTTVDCVGTPSAKQQTRQYTYDELGRLTSEINPETNPTSGGTLTKSYLYDTASNSYCSSTSAGDLISIQNTDSTGNCIYYDSLHRPTAVGYSDQTSTACRRYLYDNQTGFPGSTRPATINNSMGRLIEAATDNCGSPSDPIITDEWFSYTARGEITDFYELTPHSGGYYHSSASYWENGTVASMTGSVGGYSFSNAVDGEGRPYSNSWLSSAQYNEAGKPTKLTFTTGDYDSFAYDPNTGRMASYSFVVGSAGSSDTGTLTWNANGTLGQLAITDAFNSSNTQSCNYTHDDLVRLSHANCSSPWNQSFTYDPFGNIDASGTYTYAPIYSEPTNRISTIGGSSATYDGRGNVTNDQVGSSFAWDINNLPNTIDGSNAYYDALGRQVEVYNGTAYPRMYSPTGFLMAVPSVSKLYVPLPGGGAVVYEPTAPGGYYIRHTDWQGTTRLGSTSSRSIYFDLAMSPFGQPYAQSGSVEYSYTGQENTFTNLYDFTAREYAMQGRWSSPDPAGLSSTTPVNPQSWNRYAYTLNNPLRFVDPTGRNLANPGGCNSDQENCSGGLGSEGSGIGTPFCAAESESCSPGSDENGVPYNFGPGYLADKNLPLNQFAAAEEAYLQDINGEYYSFEGGDGSIRERQVESAAIAFGIQACQTDDAAGVASCIQQAYDQLINEPDLIEGGNSNFPSTLIINGQSMTAGVDFTCPMSRCGNLNSLDYSHNNGFFHVDTANVWVFPFGTAVHFFVDILAGNIIFQNGLPKYP